jgi:hypothetical protein
MLDEKISGGVNVKQGILSNTANVFIKIRD